MVLQQPAEGLFAEPEEPKKSGIETAREMAAKIKTDIEAEKIREEAEAKRAELERTPADNPPAEPPTMREQIKESFSEATEEIAKPEMKALVTQQNKEKGFLQVKTEFMNPVIFQQKLYYAQSMVQSKSLPEQLDNPFKVLMCIEAGSEMGMNPIESTQSLYPVRGQWNLWGKAIAKQLRKHGWMIKYEDKENECTATVWKGDETYSETITFAEADKSGYTKGNSGIKIGWREGMNRKLKLRYGALNMILKTYIPEVLGMAVGIVEWESDVTDERPKSIEAMDDESIEGNIANALKKRKEERVENAGIPVSE